MYINVPGSVYLFQLLSSEPVKFGYKVITDICFMQLLK